uniref:Uncharacterized protein n=1 Tax=Arundo donax TaxID=35708 RepID=A0A0A9HLP1_ARUDO
MHWDFSMISLHIRICLRRLERLIMNELTKFTGGL